MKETYSSIRSPVSTHMKVEGSRFIADAFPVTSEDEAKAELERVRRKFFDATHHCFAYVIGAEQTIVRYSDDGEPSGTAGIKIYSAIQSQHLSDILIVITRYFGGTKLGVGGLGRAYYDAALHVIQSAYTVVKAVMHIVDIQFAFSETNPVMNAVQSNNSKVIDTHYNEHLTYLRVLVLPSRYDTMKSLILNSTRARAEVSLIGEKIVFL